MTSVAVVAHYEKTLGDGLPALREALAGHGVTDPIWIEIPKSAKAPKAVQDACRRGADLIFVWGGDGTVQRAVDTLATSKRTLAILPAGTANLLAGNLGIPKDLEQAVTVGLHGQDRVLDVGKMNGEHFAVMGGMGLDSLMIRDADGTLKDKLGRAAYVFTGARRSRQDAVPMRVKIDGTTWFRGDAGCVLIGNVGELLGGLTAFEHAKTDDGLLDVAVITASGSWQWARALTRAAVGHAEKSPLVHVTQAKKIVVETKKALPYEMDGGARPKTNRLKVRVVPAAITVRVPEVSA
jgi:YegS/Rv2252/BmrU family lipid kinase